MENTKKKGIFLIILGLLIPLFALPFVSGFDINKGFMDNFYNTGIRITGNNQQISAPPVKTGTENPGNGLDPKKMRIEKIPFRLFFVPMVLLIYIGIVFIDKARKKLPDQNS